MEFTRLWNAVMNESKSPSDFVYHGLLSPIELG